MNTETAEAYATVCQYGARASQIAVEWAQRAATTAKQSDLLAAWALGAPNVPGAEGYLSEGTGEWAAQNIGSMREAIAVVGAALASLEWCAEHSESDPAARGAYLRGIHRLAELMAPAVFTALQSAV